MYAHIYDLETEIKWVKYEMLGSCLQWSIRAIKHEIIFFVTDG